MQKTDKILNSLIQQVNLKRPQAQKGTNNKEKQDQMSNRYNSILQWLWAEKGLVITEVSESVRTDSITYSYIRGGDNY